MAEDDGGLFAVVYLLAWSGWALREEWTASFEEMKSYSGSSVGQRRSISFKSSSVGSAAGVEVFGVCRSGRAERGSVMLPCWLSGRDWVW